MNKIIAVDAYNKIYPYLPKGINYREPVTTEHFLNPTIVVIAPKDNSINSYLIYGNYCRIFRSDSEERIDQIPDECMKELMKILQFYQKNIEIFDKNCQEVEIQKSYASFFFNNKHYILSLKPTENMGNYNEMGKFVDIFIDDLERWVKMVKERINEIDMTRIDEIYRKVKPKDGEFDFDFDFGQDKEDDKNVDYMKMRKRIFEIIDEEMVENVVKEILALSQGTEFAVADFLPKTTEVQLENNFKTALEIIGRLKGEIICKEPGAYTGLPQYTRYIRK